MEKHKCKLCFRSFSNGRALGGHMRSHVMNLAKKEEESSRTIQLSFEAESSPSPFSSSSSSSSSSSEDEDNDDNDDDDDDIKDVCSVLQENPKRSITEFSCSVILQDRESETESSKNNPTRKRSKRVWEIRRCDHTHNNNNKTESWVDHEPVSSVSDTTTEEDVAFCLMMLSRDKWKTQKDQHEEDDEEHEHDEIERSLEESYESRELKKNQVRKGRYKCETCDKVFRSYQALGGHRASHKKIKMNIKVDHEEEIEGEKMVEKKIHECPVCLRVFASGQALGGHKRTHVNGSSATTTTTTVPVFSSSKRFIDLNLPAPIDYDDDDDISQFENSAVSDAEFVKTR